MRRKIGYTAGAIIVAAGVVMAAGTFNNTMAQDNGGTE